MRQSARRRTRNLLKKEAYKHAVRDVRKAIVAGKPDEAKKMLPKLYQALDKAAKTNVIKKNKAARLKSRLSRIVSKKVV